MINDDIVQDILHGHIQSRDSLTRGYMLLIDGKIFHKDGKFIYKTKSQLTRTFYDTISWRAKSILYRAAYPEDRDYIDYSRRRGNLWKEFKTVLKDKYNMEIVEI